MSPRGNSRVRDATAGVVSFTESPTVTVGAVPGPITDVLGALHQRLDIECRLRTHRILRKIPAMDGESGAVEPSLIRKLSYLAGIRAADGHKGWVAELISDPRVRRRGLLLAVPNTVAVAVLSLVILLTGDRSTAVMLACIAVVVLIGGVASGWVIERRTSWLAKRNDVRPPLI